MTATPLSAAHPVYPGGPPCNPNCPGPWSMYHDGYADGYENAERQARAAERRRLWERVAVLAPVKDRDWITRAVVLALLADDPEPGA